MDDKKNEVNTPEQEKQNKITVCEKPQEEKKSSLNNEFTYIW